jgi:methionyl-tRNA synthetase
MEITNESLVAYVTAHPWIIVALIWTIIWKGLALWQASKRNEKIWFIAMLVVNTVGILEIIYLAYLYFRDKKSTSLTTPEIK